MLENGSAATLAEENLITHEDIGGTQLASFHLRYEAVRLREGPHQKPSRMFETKVRANWRDSRWNAGESSWKKLESSRDTWYCSRNR